MIGDKNQVRFLEQPCAEFPMPVKIVRVDLGRRAEKNVFQEPGGNFV
jgi:hypothetical protein